MENKSKKREKEQRRNPEREIAIQPNAALPLMLCSRVWSLDWGFARIQPTIASMRVWRKWWKLKRGDTEVEINQLRLGGDIHVNGRLLVCNGSNSGKQTWW
ncbi:hypothetical protein ACLOJK_008814 [Asimina triloba]